jgi:hypothetical protein
MKPSEVRVCGSQAVEEKRLRACGCWFRMPALSRDIMEAYTKARNWIYSGLTSPTEWFELCSTGQRIHSHVYRRGQPGRATKGQGGWRYTLGEAGQAQVSHAPRRRHAAKDSAATKNAVPSNCAASATACEITPVLCHVSVKRRCNADRCSRQHRRNPMGKRGPRPEPTIYQDGEGQPRQAAAESKASQSRQAMTSRRRRWVTGVSLEKWEEVVPKLVGMGVMTNADMWTPLPATARCTSSS